MKKYSPADHLAAHPEFISKESLTVLDGFKAGYRGYLRLDRAEALREIANKFQVPNDRRSNRNEVVVFLKHTRHLLERALAVKEKGIAVGVAVRCCGGSSIVKRIQRDFIVVLENGESSPPQNIFLA